MKPFVKKSALAMAAVAVSTASLSSANALSSCGTYTVAGCQNVDKLLTTMCYNTIGWLVCNGSYQGTSSPSGTWGCFWHGFANYCEAQGIWYGVDRSRWTEAWDNESFSFMLKKGSGEKTYSGRKLGKQDGRYVSLAGAGEAKTTGVSITIPNFNSPFVYLENAPAGKVSVSVDSEWDLFTAQAPAFNRADGWNLDSDGKSVTLGGEGASSLFYEIALSKVELSRNGRNFASKEELVSFLKNGGFYESMGFTADEKADSLGYVLGKIPEGSANYYLTVMDPSSVSKVSDLSVSPAPERLDRRYFAVYPTDVPVKTSEDLSYPAPAPASSGFVAKEHGEIVVTDSMSVLWK